MSFERSCRVCGTVLDARQQGRVCPRCQLERSLRMPEEEIQAELLEITSGADRATFVEEVCRGDAERKERLLAWVAAQSGSSLPQEVINGRYRLLEKIGEGGFGSVYLALQRTPVQRQVAVKVLKAGMDTRQVVARFELERQTLARMDHPHIARVYDAGETESGRPYFVMEWVRGVPITEYCQREELPLRRRLELFAKICQAVQHAHQKGIIHRDLKPSNILVTVQEAAATPKIIDFGIAKAMEPSLSAQPALTQEAQFLGTPAYISPEQVALSGDIDTRSDIYSLGVLLYELLTGTTPFDAGELVRGGVDEMRRIIRETEPLRPSTRLHRDGRAPASDPARSRIDRDLDWIVLTCLQKDRAMRYATANGLAMDVLRYLAEEPIVARPPSALYRVRKAVRRHRLVVVAAGAALAALIAGTIVSTWEAVRARRAEREQIQLRQELEAELNRRSGEFEAKRGHWKEAVGFYQKAIELLPMQQEFYHDLSALLAELEDLPLYRETCRRALATFGQTTDPRVAERMTKDCLVLPVPGVEPEVLSRLAQVAVTESSQHLQLPWFRTDLTWFELAKGLAEYRCGRFTNALTWLEKSLAAAEDIGTDPGRVYVQVQGRALLAMAQARLGRGVEAQATLEEATRRARTYLPQLSIHGLTDYWPDWIYAHILLREASQELDKPRASEGAAVSTGGSGARKC